MKTLDEVIFEAPYSPTPWEADALHYLKAFRDTKNALDAERERTIEAYCQWQDAKEKLEAQTSQMMWVDKHFQFEISDNPPLTWDELKTLEGKPVWYEHEFWKGWIILGKVEQGVNCEMIPDREERWYIVKDGSAKAYRKERK